MGGRVPNAAGPLNENTGHQQVPDEGLPLLSPLPVRSNFYITGRPVKFIWVPELCLERDQNYHPVLYGSPPKDVCVLILGTCDYVRGHDQEGFQAALGQTWR